MEGDLLSLYRRMLRSRKFEEAVSELWDQGRISAEMHLGIGEEGIVAGVVDHLRDGDAMALDHRGTPPLVMRGVDLVLLLKEFLGDPDGLCGGCGGHMHLFSREHLAASSGIVGAAGPTACGFALAAQHLRPEGIAVAFFGEGAMNQGMLMESMNLAAAWKLPVLFVCKDNGMAITTRSADVTGGSLLDRARGFGLGAEEVDGWDVEAVWRATQGAVERARAGDGPSFLHARCLRPQGHFLGDPLHRIAERPVKEMKEILGPLVRSATSGSGASVGERAASLGTVTTLIGRSARDHYWPGRDPLAVARRKLHGEGDRLAEIEREAEREVRDAVQAAMAVPGLN